MQSGRISQTALKVALTMVTLNEKPGWRERLPPGLGSVSERLILAAQVFGYGPGMMAWSKRRWTVGFYDAFEVFTPGVFEGLGERKIFMDEQARAAIDLGAEQVLVLGAGFDALCLRLAPCFGGVRFVEVDHPATSAAKARGVAREGKPANLELIAADLAETSLSRVLGSCEGWESDKRTMVIAEGLFMYLTGEQILELFRQVGECVGAGSRFAFSHLQELGRHGLARLLLRLTGEPWLSASRTEALSGYIGSGWQVIEAREVQDGRAFEGFAVAELAAPAKAAPRRKSKKREGGQKKGGQKKKGGEGG